MRYACTWAFGSTGSTSADLALPAADYRDASKLVLAGVFCILWHMHGACLYVPLQGKGRGLLSLRCMYWSFESLTSDQVKLAKTVGCNSATHLACLRRHGPLALMAATTPSQHDARPELVGARRTRLVLSPQSGIIISIVPPADCMFKFLVLSSMHMQVTAVCRNRNRFMHA